MNSRMTPSHRQARQQQYPLAVVLATLRAASPGMADAVSDEIQRLRDESKRYRLRLRAAEAELAALREER